MNEMNREQRNPRSSWPGAKGKGREKRRSTPCTVSIGPLPEWDHLGISSIVPGQRLLLVPSQDTDSVSIVSLDELAVLATVQLAEGSAPWYAKATPDGRYAYVTNSRFNGHVDTSPRENSTVSVIDLKEMRLAKEIPVMVGPVMIEMDERRDRAYVTNRGSNTVTVIDTQAHESIGEAEVGASPFWVRLAPRGDLLVVGNFEDATLSLIDPDEGKVVNTISVGVPRLPTPYPEFGPGDTIGFSITREGIAYVANWRSHTIVSVDIYQARASGRRAVMRSEQLIKYPFHVELDEDLGLAVVGSYDVQDSRLAIFELDGQRETLGKRISMLPVNGTALPEGRAAAVNYWMSEPFQSRIIGLLSQGLRVPNPIDLVAAVL